MYIGSTDQEGSPFSMGILDNAIGEALSGFGNEIVVTIQNDNSIELETMVGFYIRCMKR